jgi:predicted nucleic acid-binding protein
LNSDFPVIIDACVLVQPTVRDTILRLSERRLFLARWSDDIIAELDRTLIKFGVPREKVDHLVSEMKEYFPDAWVEPGYKELIPAMKNDEKDRHVVAAAVKAGCELIVTYNLKHFREEHLRPLDQMRGIQTNSLLISIIWILRLLSMPSINKEQPSARSVRFRRYWNGYALRNATNSQIL